MSVFLSSLVWKCELEPMTKLVLLSLADQANDEGECWPSMRSLCGRTCLALTTVRDRLAELEGRGIITREARQAPGTGRQTSNLFRISESAMAPLLPAVPSRAVVAPPTAARPLPLPPDSRGEGTAAQYPLNHKTEPSPEPQRNQQEPAPEGELIPAVRVSIPFALIRDAFNRLCPSLAKIRDIVGRREAMVRGRWDTLKELASFEELFTRVERSDFLTGRKKGRDQRQFIANFDWIMTPANFSKVLEGRYDNPTLSPNATRPAQSGSWKWNGTDA